MSIFRHRLFLFFMAAQLLFAHALSAMPVACSCVEKEASTHGASACCAPTVESNCHCCADQPCEEAPRSISECCCGCGSPMKSDNQPARTDDCRAGQLLDTGFHTPLPSDQILIARNTTASITNISACSLSVQILFCVWRT